MRFDLDNNDFNELLGYFQYFRRELLYPILNDCIEFTNFMINVHYTTSEQTPILREEIDKMQQSYEKGLDIIVEDSVKDIFPRTTIPEYNNCRGSLYQDKEIYIKYLKLVKKINNDILTSMTDPDKHTEIIIKKLRLQKFIANYSEIAKISEELTTP